MWRGLRLGTQRPWENLSPQKALAMVPLHSRAAASGWVSSPASGEGPEAKQEVGSKQRRGSKVRSDFQRTRRTLHSAKLRKQPQETKADGILGGFSTSRTRSDQGRRWQSFPVSSHHPLGLTGLVTTTGASQLCPWRDLFRAAICHDQTGGCIPALLLLAGGPWPP